MLYLYECAKCGRREEDFRPVEQRHDGPRCCRRPMFIVICPAQVQVDFPAYVSPASGRRITTRAERRADLKATNSRPWEGLEVEKKEAARRKAEAEAKLDRKVEETARTLYHQLPPSQRKALETP